jgi:hypothetical protein
MVEQTLQFQLCEILSRGGEWTITQLARAAGLKPNTTIRVILETLVFTGVVRRAWVRTSNKRLGWSYWAGIEQHPDFWGECGNVNEN